MQEDWKPDSDDDLEEVMALYTVGFCNTVAESTGNKGSPTIKFYALDTSRIPTIEFYALDMRSSPHDFHGIIDKYEIPPRKRGITRTVCRCIR